MLRLFLSNIVTGLFLSLCLVADALYGIAMRDGPSGLYFWPILGPMALWPAWVLVFSGLVFCFFSYGLILGVKRIPQLHVPSVHLPISLHRAAPSVLVSAAAPPPAGVGVVSSAAPAKADLKKQLPEGFYEIP